jgi:CheY-like chemotaxis protein
LSRNNSLILTGMKLLIVEDNPEMRRLIVSIVSDLTDSITECADGDEALAMYSELRPDLVLMDVRMARVDGITASRKIIADFPEAHICAVTDYTDPQTREAARRAGISNYISKENLFEIREILERSNYR